MGVLLFALLPAGILIAVIPVRKARLEALEGRHVDRYLRRVAVLVGWPVLVVTLTASLIGREVGIPGFWIVVFAPGALIALARLADEGPSIRKVVRQSAEG